MTSNLRHSQLQDVCEQRSLDSVGLKKAQILALLKQSDIDMVAAEADATDSTPESDVEIELMN